MTIIGVIILGIVLFVIIRGLTSEDKAAKEQEERLKDETIYDPLTGRSLRLEEAENEVLVYDSEGPRIMSDEEIEKHYTGTSKEMEYITRHAAMSGSEDVEDENVLQLFQKSGLFNDVDIQQIFSFWKISSTDYLGIATIRSSFDQGRSDGITFEPD